LIIAPEQQTELERLMTKRRSSEQGLALVRRFRDSGMGRVEFCQCEKIKVWTLQYWLGRSKELRRREREPVRFVELRSSTEGQNQLVKMKLELPSGVVISFDEVPHFEFTAQLVSELQKAC
jgi:hypothetical protein